MSTERFYSSRRLSIVNAIVAKLADINGQYPFRSDIEGRVTPRLLFWDEVQEFPSVHVNAGTETRQYQTGGYKDRFLTVTIRCYVKSENAVDELEGLIEDIETVLETCSRLEYKDRDGKPQYTQLISIASIDTDEGVLDPLGIGEIICEVRY